MCMHATQNPAAFDFEAWGLQQGIRATGYIIFDSFNQKLPADHHFFWINRLRQSMQDKLQLYLPDTMTSPWLTALIIGERTHIAADAWEVLRNTGTNHLMAIAGLHLGMLAACMHFLTQWLWRRSTFLLQKLPASLAGALAAMIAVIFYSMLAGFSIPTQRASCMLMVVTIVLFLRIKINPWQLWASALFIVLFINPMDVLSESFWLSFMTIALIIYGMSGRLHPTGKWWQWGRVQWVIGFGLMPLTLFFFQSTSIISFIANAIAIPWLMISILPFCFMSAVTLLIVPSIAQYFLLCADKSLALLWQVLTWLSHLPLATWQHAIISWPILFCSIIAILLLLLPTGVPGRWLGIIWAMPLLLFTPAVPVKNNYWLTLLDVGQGLSVVVQTEHHLLVYDAGPKFNDNSDAGENIVTPFLHQQLKKKIDRLVISHGDNDHIGGAFALLKHFAINDIKTSVPDKIKQADFCRAGETWNWDGVQFTFIYPDQNQLTLGNDSSCVLLIDNKVHRALLTGDIEKFAENQLIQKEINLSADILIAPHHGSKTSGMKKFIAAVHPQYVLYATGYRNRYHFPHPSVVHNYTEISAMQLNTAETGAMQFKISQKNELTTPELFRVKYKRYWFA
jgi:competence protein ComEC